MKRIGAVLLGVALAIGAGALAATGGGFPSRPNFQAVGIGQTAGATGTVTTSGAATFGGNVLMNGAANPRIQVNGTSGNALLGVQNAGSLKGYLCVSITAGSCVTGDAANDVSLVASSGTLRLSADNGATAAASLTPAGVLNVKSGGDLTINAVSVCRSDGTNCPAASTGAGANFVGVSTANATRTSNVTLSCDAALTVSIPNATARYKFSAFLQFQGGGITANGWRVSLTGAGGTFVTRWLATATTNTTTTNASTVSMLNTAADPMTAVFNAAGIDTFVQIDGTISVTSPATPTLCVGWAQNTSNATASTLVAGSSLALTRLN